MGKSGNKKKSLNLWESCCASLTFLYFYKQFSVAHQVEDKTNDEQFQLTSSFMLMLPFVGYYINYS